MNARRAALSVLPAAGIFALSLLLALAPAAAQKVSNTGCFCKSDCGPSAFDRTPWCITQGHCGIYNDWYGERWDYCDKGFSGCLCLWRDGYDGNDSTDKLRDMTFWVPGDMGDCIPQCMIYYTYGDPPAFEYPPYVYWVSNDEVQSVLAVPSDLYSEGAPERTATNKATGVAAAAASTVVPVDKEAWTTRPPIKSDTRPVPPPLPTKTGVAATVTGTKKTGGLLGATEAVPGPPTPPTATATATPTGAAGPIATTTSKPSSGLIGSAAYSWSAVVGALVAAVVAVFVV
ncbi:hypothetical protein DFJ74DRAFT_665064 [Hyaloraphidium curvatum]|nr:hypothetical protein DFJ74DRAFT_665064 [Hyaloraphidium curvatum]